MAITLEPYLEDLEARIDPAVENDLYAAWVRFASGKHPTPLFSPARPAPNPPRLPWPEIRINAAMQDPSLLLLSELGGASRLLAQAGGNLLNARANYGTPIMATLFGGELFLMPDETNTLPASEPLPGGADAIRRLLDAGMPSLDQPYAQKVFEFGERFVQIRKRYPNLARHVHLYHPDLQGPMDILEMVWGSGFFLDIMDMPELVHDFLRLITATYTAFLIRWNQIEPPSPDGFGTHWGYLYRGQIMLRDDSAMNLSPEMFREFILPYDRQLLATFGGGAIHACGHVDHFLGDVATLPNLHGFNLSQPHLNDMSLVYSRTIDRNIPLLGLALPAAQTALATGQPNLHLVHCA